MLPYHMVKVLSREALFAFNGEYESVLEAWHKNLEEEVTCDGLARVVELSIKYQEHVAHVLIHDSSILIAKRFEGCAAPGCDVGGNLKELVACLFLDGAAH
jgi:hypothetical protein